MADEWVSKEFGQTAEFWILEALRDIMVDKGIIPKESFLKGIKIEWKLGKELEIKYLADEQ